MIRGLHSLGFIVVLLCLSCQEQQKGFNIPSPTKQVFVEDSLSLSADDYYDKVLGALVGSAIGDAMGASTEMWHRKDIQRKYGYLTGLSPATRSQSPEGTWEHNLQAGATTDDTRWKYLMADYFNKNQGNLSGDLFADHLVSYYQNLTEDLSGKAVKNNPDLLDIQMEKVDWVKEWARVALAYKEGTEAYLKAQNRFYGGEMSCAGMLYSPMFGLVANTPVEAYQMGYAHSLFDLGYAKDISSLVSAMTHMALRTATTDSILDVAVFVDPLRYQDSRLVGRIPYNIAEAAQKMVLLSYEVKPPLNPQLADSLTFEIPEGFQGDLKEWLQQDYLYRYLEEHEREIAFHAGEIWEILVTGLAFGQGDFEKTIQFIVNYGRDNDTVAAVAGMILGAQNGFSNLPQDMALEVLRVNRDELGIDLEAVAKELSYPSN